MKKSLIAVAGASLAAAAMPAVGVFAVQSQVIDTVKVTITDSCTIVNRSDSAAPSQEGDPGSSSSVVDGNQVVKNTYAVTMALGQLKQGIGGSGADSGAGARPDAGGASQTGGSVEVVCNDGEVTPSIDPNPAQPTGGAGSWKLSAAGANGGKMIGDATSAGDPHEIATGTATSGATSNWAFKIEGTSGETAYAGTYASYSEIPSSDTNIISGKGAFTFKPRYQIYIGTSQAADTYTGTVTYTLTAPAV